MFIGWWREQANSKIIMIDCSPSIYAYDVIWLTYRLNFEMVDMFLCIDFWTMNLEKCIMYEFYSQVQFIQFIIVSSVNSQRKNKIFGRGFSSIRFKMNYYFRRKFLNCIKLQAIVIIVYT